MKNVSSGLATHLTQDATTLCTLWKVTRIDGQVFGFTDHDENIVFPIGSPTGLTYVASTGYTRSALSTSGALNVDNVDLDGAFSSTALTEADLLAGLWDYASVEISMVNYADLSQGALQQRKGRLGETRAGRSMFTTELRGMMQNLQQDAGRLCGPSCDADLGDARCGVALSGSPTTFTFAGIVTTVDSNRVFYDAALANVTGFFDYGKVTWTSGDNVGLSMEVKTFIQGSPPAAQITLQLPMPHGVDIGDTFTIQAGCDKSLATCKAKFNNVINFQGFPYVPGMDRMISGGL